MLKKRKKTVIICVIIAIIVLALVIGGIWKKNTSAATSSNITTEKVVRTTIDSSVSATGKVKSKKSTDVSADVANVKVKSVAVSVGDKVKKGQVLCKFDVNDADESLQDAQQDLNNQETAQSLSKASAERAYELALKTRKVQIESATLDKKSAKTAYESARSAYKGGKTKLASLESDMDAAEEEYEDLIDSSASSDEITQASVDYAVARATYISYESTYATLKSTYLSAKLTYEKADSAYQATVDAQNAAVANAKDAITSAEIGTSTSAAEGQVRTYKQTVKNGVLYSPVSGTVTDVNYSAGDTYTSGTVVTIKNTNNLYITTNVDEYDINNVTDGMRVLIKTDATGDEILYGKVKEIAPTAAGDSSSASTLTGVTASASGSSSSSDSSDATYKVKISLDSQDSRLKIDMTAKLSLLIAEKSNVLAVPYDAVYKTSTGKTYIKEVISSNKSSASSETRRIPVTVGIESGYYVEIVGDGIKEGMVVQIPETDSSADSTYGNMSATGGM